MAENEQNTPPSSEQDNDGEGSAKKRRRRRGRRRPKGEGSQENASSEGDEKTSDTSKDSADADGDGASEKKSRSRRRKKKKPEGEKQESSDQMGDSKESAGDGKDKKDGKNGKDSKGGKSGKDGKKGRGRRDGGKKDKEKKERAPRGSVLDRRRTRGEAELDFPDDEPIIPKVLPTATSVDGYIKQLRGWQREVVMTLRSIVKSQAGEAEEDILWHQPVYSLNGPVCYIKAFSDHVNLGFWRGNELDDPAERLVGELQTMRHVTIRHVNEVDRDLFEAYVRQAVKLNKEKGDPTGI